MVYLVDDNHPFRRSTALVLETSGVKVLDFDSPEALLAELERDPAVITPTHSCVVSDMRMPGMSGLALLEEIQRRKYDAPVIFITAHGDVALAVESMRRGAANFIEKPFAIDVLIQAIQLATTPPPSDAPVDPRLASLSDRERQVAELIVAGKANKVIGDILGISNKTVELHRGAVMAKVGVRTVPDLVKVFLGYKQK